jgi:uncharacterized protein YjbJ (UPF0337 family)
MGGQGKADQVKGKVQNTVGAPPFHFSNFVDR